MQNIFNLIKEAQSADLEKMVSSSVAFLKGKKTLVLGFSNRWQGEGSKKDISKTETLGRHLAESGGEGSSFLDAFKLKIYSCEANISRSDGNSCGVKDSALKDKDKNPSGNHRCWASINNKDDELWKISKAIFEADVVIFVTPVRWGQACATYQKLIERLSWLENRHTTLGEDNILKNKQAGFVCLGHNWNGSEVLKTQKQVLSFFGFDVVDDLCWNWQWTSDPKDESQKGYKEDYKDFKNNLVKITVKQTENS